MTKIDTLIEVENIEAKKPEYNKLSGELEHQLSFIREELQKTVGDTTKSGLRTVYSDLWELVHEDKLGPEVTEAFKLLKGKPLIDLGGGDALIVPKLANDFDVSLLLNVDAGGITNEDEVHEKLPNLNYKTKEVDMLTFLSNLDDNSANVSINGIDSWVIGSEEYHQALANEIERVVPMGGIVYGCGSSALLKLNKEKFNTIFEYRDEIGDEKKNGITGIYRKNINA